MYYLKLWRAGSSLTKWLSPKNMHDKPVPVATEEELIQALELYIKREIRKQGWKLEITTGHFT